MRSDRGRDPLSGTLRARDRAVAVRRGATARAKIARALLAAVVLALAGTAAAHATLVFGTVTTEPSPPRAGEPLEIRLELTDPTDTHVEDAIVNVEVDPQPDVPATAGGAAADDGTTTSGAAAAGDDAAGDDATGDDATGDDATGDATDATTGEATDDGTDGAADATMGSTADPAAADAGAASIVSDRFEEFEPGFYRTEIVLPHDGAWTLTFRDRTFRQEEALASITLLVGEDVDDTPLSFIFPPTATGPQSLTTWLVWLIGLPIVAGAVVTVMVLRGDTAQGEEAPAGTDGPGDGRG